MNFGISTACFYPELLEKSLEHARDLGYKDIEIFFNTDSEYSDSFISYINNFLKENKMRVISAHPFSSFAEPQYFFSDYKRRYDDGIEYYKYIFHQVAKTGCKIFQFHGAFLRQQITPELYAEIYIDLKKIASFEGLILSQENVSRCLCGQKSYIEKLKKLLGKEISFTLDLKQAGRAGEDPKELAVVMRDINMVHINDSTADEDCLLPCMGKVNLLEIKNILDGLKFDGFFMTEVYSQNYKNFSEISESKIKLKRLFEGK